MAGVDSIAGISITALLELSIEVVAQLYTVIYDPACGVVVKIGSVEVTSVLWDSQG
jgi:hypothetical protein